MSRSRIRHLSVCLVLALSVTGGAVALDAQRTAVHQTIAGLGRARQLVSQVEGMIFKAKENGEADPIGWALGYLAQGVEPRSVHLSHAQIELTGDHDSRELEQYEFHADTSTFEYTKILVPETGAGVKITVALGYLGFLGGNSAATADLLALLVFASFGIIAFFVTGRWFGFEDGSKVAAAFVRFRTRVSEWVEGSKTQLTQHGSHIRELVRQAQRLAVSAGKSRQHVSELRDKIHEGLTELHDSRSLYNEGEEIAQRAEKLALDLSVEASRLIGQERGGARKFAEMAAELHRQVQVLNELHRKGKTLVRDLEKKIEPWSTDADLAHQAFDEVGEATRLLSQHINETRSSLVSQAKLIQSAREEFAAPEARQESQAALAAEPGSKSALRIAAATEASSGAVETVARQGTGVGPTPSASADGAFVGADGAPAPVGAQVTRLSLPEPLPPIEDQDSQPLFKRLRAKKSA